METNPDYLSLRDAAIYLGVNRTWLAGAIAASDIPITPIGQSKAVRRADLERLRSLKPGRRRRATTST